MSDQRSKRATLYDVAKFCKVSYQTVSRVVNGSPNVSTKTRERILNAIETLGYQPNRAAQALVTRRSHTLQVITTGLGEYFPTQIVANVERVARSQGYHLIVTNVEDSAEDIKQMGDYLNIVDGIVMVAPVHYDSFPMLLEACEGIPMIQTSVDIGATDASVIIDQRLGSRLATQHLINLGHQYIAEISGPLSFHDALARHESWLATLSMNRLSPVAYVQSDWSAIGGYQAAHQLLDFGKAFTGLIVGCDQIAIGAMRAFRERGYSIPDNISIVGFDDIPDSAYFEPPLTTIRQDAGLLGKECVEYLLELIASPQLLLRQRVMQPQLIERQSTRRIVTETVTYG